MIFQMNLPPLAQKWWELINKEQFYIKAFLNVSIFTCNQNIFATYLNQGSDSILLDFDTFSLAVLGAGKMNQILFCDWLLEWTTGKKSSISLFVIS